MGWGGGLSRKKVKGTYTNVEIGLLKIVISTSRSNVGQKTSSCPRELHFINRERGSILYFICIKIQRHQTVTAKYRPRKGRRNRHTTTFRGVDI